MKAKHAMAGSPFAAPIFFASGALVVFSLEMIYETHPMFRVIVGVARFITFLILFGVLWWAVRKLPSARPTVLIGIVFLSAKLALAVTSDIELLTRLSLVGSDSQWNFIIEKATLCGWVWAALYAPYALSRELFTARSDLQQRDNELGRAEKRLDRAHSDLNEARLQLARSERVAFTGLMAGGVAHDLKNALTPVFAFAELAESDDIAYRHRNLFEVMHGSIQHAVNVLKQLQAMQAQRSQEANEELVSLTETVSQAIQLTRFQWHDEALKRGLVYEVLRGLRDDCQVHGDPTELIQLVVNLISNAIDAMPNGGRIDISVARTNGIIRLSVSDNGIGMSDERRSKCLEPFFTTKGDGRGLGLSVCRDIVSRHHGEIEIQQNLNGGTRFVIVFSGTGASTTKTKSVRQKMVLYVDDDEAVRASMSALLESNGVLVDVAADGQSALQIIQDRRYALFIVDYGMPGMTGRELIVSLKRLAPDVPIAVVSGWPRESVVEQFDDVSSKPDMFLEKPVSAKSVRDCLRICVAGASE